LSRWLTCALCRRRKPVGIMTAQAWGTVNGGSRVAHACPDCQDRHPDWRDQLTELLDRSE